MLSLFLLPPLLRLASAQLFSGVPGSSADQSSFNGSHFCNQTSADANATAIHSWNPQVGATDTNISYMGSVYQPADGQGYTELCLWFSPGDQNYTDNFRLGYDVCYLWLPQLTLNTLERGASDNGSWVQTFDESCERSQLAHRHLLDRARGRTDLGPGQQFDHGFLADSLQRLGEHADAEFSELV